MLEQTTREIVAKLWNLCHILRDDGVTYNEYVTELTSLLFLKMTEETGREDVLPNGYRYLGTKGKATVAAIFVDAHSAPLREFNCTFAGKLQGKERMWKTKAQRDMFRQLVLADVLLPRRRRYS
jgi:type I restriction-modification system DNA methylase subunit